MENLKSLSDEDSDEDLEFGDFHDQAENAYLEYEEAALEWDNLDLPPHIEEKHECFLGAARKWNRFRNFGRRSRDHHRLDHKYKKSGHARRYTARPRFKFKPKSRGAYMAGKKNPVGKDGQVMQCSICQSEEHLRAYCPKKHKLKLGPPGFAQKKNFWLDQSQSSSSGQSSAVMPRYLFAPDLTTVSVPVEPEWTSFYSILTKIQPTIMRKQ